MVLSLLSEGGSPDVSAVLAALLGEGPSSFDIDDIVVKYYVH